MKIEFNIQVDTVSTLAILFSGMLVSNFLWNANKTPLPEVPATSLSAPVIRNVDLGMHSAAASLLWLKIIQDVNSWMSHYQNIAVDIGTINAVDPEWKTPYEFGTIMLSGFGQFDQAIAIGKNGMKNVPEDWKIPYYIATAYNQNKDEINTLRYFMLASKVPGIPADAKKAAESFGTATNSKRAQTKKIWQAIGNNATDEITKDEAQKYIDYIDYLDAIESATSQYKAKTGNDPKKLQDLIDAGVLKNLPINPLQ